MEDARHPQFTDEEIAAVLELINSSAWSGGKIETAYTLKQKVSAAVAARQAPAV